MAMTIEIAPADQLVDLMDALAGSGCLANRAGATACQVLHPLASSDYEAQLEVAFFLRAWQLSHPGVDATLTA